MFARSLIGHEPSQPIIDRYIAAHEHVLTPQADSIVAFVRRCPWSLPLLDAACAWREPDGLLRRKMIVTVALLETAPQHREAFVYEPRGKVAYMTRCFTLGVSASIKVLLGLFFYAWVRLQS